MEGNKESFLDPFHHHPRCHPPADDASAGYNATLAGRTLPIDCSSSCRVMVEAVGSRVYVFNATLESGTGAAGGLQ